MRRCLPETLIAAAVLLLAMPAAQAQPSPTAPDAEATIDEPPRVEPAGSVETTTLTVTYNCAKEHPTEATEIQIEVVESPDWLYAQPVHTNIFRAFKPEVCPQESLRRSVDVDVFLAADPDAPARQPADLTVEATVTLADGNHTADATTQVEAAFYGKIDVTGDTQRQAAPDEEATSPITVQNQGNGPIEVALSVAEADDGLSVELPEGGQAPAPWQSGEATWSGEIALTGEEPNTVYQAEIAVDTAYAEDPSIAGDDATRFINLETTGDADAQTQAQPATGSLLPGFSAGFAAVLAIGMAWLRRED